MTAVKTIAAALVAAASLTTTNAAAAEPGAETYRKTYPQITAAAADRAAQQADERKRLYDELTRDGGPTYGGAWFDPPSGVLHVAVTTQPAADRAAARGRDLGLDIRTHLVRRSYAELERQANALRGSTTDPIGRAAGDQVGIDVTTNQVVAAVPAAQRTALLERGRAAGVSVVADPGDEAEEDACTARDACDSVIRAGAMLWRSGFWACSAGFTTRQPFTGTRFVFTAGHCTTGNGVTWGTGAQNIGPMWASFDGGNVDTALIQVTNALYTNDPGGDMYKTFDVDDVAPSVSYIVSGERVCLSANFSDPTASGNLCGTVGSNSDPFHRGMVHVNGLDACPGDSGGGWYWETNGFRTAYGIHSRSDSGCREGNDDDSWFTAISIADVLFDPALVVEEK
jgi:streptogrisin C